jgi:hypothetical protein
MGPEIPAPCLFEIVPAHPAKQRIVFAATGWTIDFAGCEDVVAGLPHVFQGWDLKIGHPSDFPRQKPRALIGRRGAGWHWREMGAPKARDWDSIPPTTPMRVITDVHDAAIYWYLAENRNLLCLHGGAVKIGGGLVCFPARGYTGKSTLVANLAARGHKVFCDDVLGLAPPKERGVSLGLMPRLRVPLAPSLSPEVRNFIATHQGPADRQWIYLKPNAGQIAKLGESAPIQAFVILERRDAGKPELIEAGTAEVLKELIAENIIRKLPMPVIFDRLHRLAATRRRYRLRYSDPGEAARFLGETFA